jgi:N-acetylglucosamine kinase-like BadF-type ATPase
MDEVIVAIDGGATKTALTVRKRTTTLLEVKGEGTNYQTSGEDKVRKVLAELLAEVRTVLPDMHVTIAIFAIAGIDSKKDEQIVRGIVEEVIQTQGLRVGKLIVENDAEATLLGATMGKPGAQLISGTGSIAFAHDGKGGIVRSGGWGHRAGDEGSGYWIGREVLRVIFRMEDGRGPFTSLTEEVLRELKLDSVQDLAGWLFNPDYSVDKIALLSRVLMKCVQQGDEVAIGIMKEAANELSVLLESVLQKCGLDKVACDVYLNGGALVHSEVLILELEKRVIADFPLCKLIVSRKVPIEYIVERGWLELRG